MVVCPLARAHIHPTWDTHTKVFHQWDIPEAAVHLFLIPRHMVNTHHNTCSNPIWAPQWAHPQWAYPQWAYPRWAYPRWGQWVYQLVLVVWSSFSRNQVENTGDTGAREADEMLPFLDIRFYIALSWNLLRPPTCILLLCTIVSLRL